MDIIRTYIAEDDFMVAKVIHEFTDKIDGFKVIGEARDGKKAFHDLSKQLPELLIMDVYMPDMDGIQLLQQLRKENIPIDVILITAARETKTIQQCLRLGAFDYIFKPFAFDRFEEALARYQKYIQLFKIKECKQELLDAVIHGKISNIELKGLPKGLQQITLNKVLEFLQSHPIALSADEISVETGLSKPTIQRYLKYLNDEEKVEKELTYGTQGRPEHKYALR